MSTPTAVRPDTARPPTAAPRGGQESGKERMELSHAILWNTDCDRLVLPRGSFAIRHPYSYHCLRQLT